MRPFLVTLSLLLLGYNADEDERAFRWQMWSWAHLQARTSGNKVYFYRFKAQQSFHGAELPYVFMLPFRVDAPAAERRLAQTVVSYWTEFARTGDPNGGGRPTWAPLDDQHDVAMFLGAEPGMGPMPDLAEHRLTDAFMNSLR